MTIDRRVTRTRRSLVEAFVALVRETRSDDLTVTRLLERANVGRSTFYAHYRGKDDLLLKSFERMLVMLDRRLDADEGVRRVAPVRELFEHVGRFRDFHDALARSGAWVRQAPKRVQILSGLIEERLAARSGADGDPAIALAIHARALAGALLAILSWWLDHDMPFSPARMDEMFHALLPSDEPTRRARGRRAGP